MIITAILKKLLLYLSFFSHVDFVLGGKSHGTVDGGIRVPGLIRWPEVVPAGTVVDTVTSLMDIFPLVSKATDTPIPEDRIIDGKDILPLLQVRSVHF